MLYTIDESVFSSDTPKVTKISLDDRSVGMVTNERIYEIDVEFNEYSTNPVDTNMVFIQGDINSSVIKAKMKLNDLPIDLSGVTVSMNLKEGSMDITTSVCTDIDVQNSVVTVRLSPFSVDEVGINKFEFVLSKGDVILVSQTYLYKIISSIGEGYIGDEVHEKTALQTLIQEVQMMKNELTLDITAQDISEVISMISGV